MPLATAKSRTATLRITAGRAGGHCIIGEKLRGDNIEAQVALARQGRYRSVAGNLRVKEVVIDDGTMRDRFVVCHNPEQAERDRFVRGADINWVGWDDLAPLDAARRSQANEVVAWLSSLSSPR